MSGDDDSRSTTKVPAAVLRQLASETTPPVDDLVEDAPWEEPAIRLTSREAVAQALEQLAAAWRAGHVVSFSIHAEITGVSRVSVAYAPDAEPIDLGELGVPE